jgi:hypothetical protein
LIIRIEIVPGPAVPAKPDASERARRELGLLGVQAGGGKATGTVAEGPRAPASTSTGNKRAPAGATATAPAQGTQSRIIATAEESGVGATGERLDAARVYAALPHRSALRRAIAFQLADAEGQGYGEKLDGPVMDLGPWRTRDDYWNEGRRPAAEAMKGQWVRWDKQKQGWYPAPKGARGRYRCNGAGIDISEGGWMKLQPGISRRHAATKSGTVNWWFADARTAAD